LVGGAGSRTISDQVAQTVTLSLFDSNATGKNVSSTQNVIFAAGVVTKFTILQPTNGTTDNPIPVTVQAQDQYGNLNTGYQTGVTLVTSGATATGGGLVTIVNGVGTKNISDITPEIVTLSLTDSQNTTKNVTSTKTVNICSGPA